MANAQLLCSCSVDNLGDPSASDFMGPHVLTIV